MINFDGASAYNSPAKPGSYSGLLLTEETYKNDDFQWNLYL